MYNLSFIEDEIHVLFWCGVYDDLRNNFVDKIEEKLSLKLRYGGLWLFDVLDLLCFILKGGGEMLEVRVVHKIEDELFLSRLIKKFLNDVMKRRKHHLGMV